LPGITVLTSKSRQLAARSCGEVANYRASNFSVYRYRPTVETKLSANSTEEKK